MIAIVDYGVGNLFSLTRSLRYLGVDAKVTGDQNELRAADRIILPGVGAFGEAMNKLSRAGLIKTLDFVAASGKPLLGICLGMQLLFERSHEFGLNSGLSYLRGEVVPLAGRTNGLKVPHIGWNSLHMIKKEDPLLKDVKEGNFVYYVHSYYADKCEDSLIAYSDYGISVPGLVHQNNIYGAQFHPEKSGTVGLGILKAFSEVT